MEQTLPKVIGKITLPDAPQKHKCVCDDCGNELNDSYPRFKISTHYPDGTKEERLICADCEFVQYGCDDEPRSIFSSTADWMRYCY